ncbi:hypothetical protein [Idiomarina sp.]|uniref:WD40 repeat domain-containing protein n=1 Tax=Idiomarina sp. TaxID=1874361 RepID=UPI002611C4BD|nr:hypothetical protein [Idiomarina sp.]
MPFIKLSAILLFTLAVSACQPSPDKIHKKVHAENGTYAADISDDGSYSLVSTDETGLLLWPRYANNAKYQWEHEEGEVSQIIDVDIAADNSVAVAASHYEFSMWDISTGENLGFWSIGNGRIQNIVVSKSGGTVVLGKRDGTQVAFNPQSGRRIEFYGHTEAINALDISPNGFYVLSASNDYTAILWDTRSGQIVHRWEYEGRMTQVALHPSGRYAFAADSTDNAVIRALPGGEEVSRLKFPDRQRIFSAARFSESGDYLITGAPSRRIAIWDTATGKLLSDWRVDLRDGGRPSNASVLAVVFDEDEKTVVSESSAGLVEWWEIDLTGSK